MLWIGIWVHPYTVRPMEVGGRFWKNGVWLTASDVVMSWLRLQIHLECIEHPCHMYKKCFSTLICCGWADEFTPILLRLCNRWSGVWSGYNLTRTNSFSLTIYCNTHIVLSLNVISYSFNTIKYYL
jgi:hypothetical protein